MTMSWCRALDEYKYPFRLGSYENSGDYPTWFKRTSLLGDREATIALENHFRQHAEQHIEAWLEVVYWKLYSQPAHRNRTTTKIADHFKENNIPPEVLWNLCNECIENPTRSNFENFRIKFGFTSRAIAIAATFPAFLVPEQFAIVDTRIAKWVGEFLGNQNRNGSPVALRRPPFLDNTSTVLTMSDFDFMCDWNRWCSAVAEKLTESTDMNWRVRDVEMAVFNAWGGRGQQHPSIHLEAVL